MAATNADFVTALIANLQAVGNLGAALACDQVAGVTTAVAEEMARVNRVIVFLAGKQSPNYDKAIIDLTSSAALVVAAQATLVAAQDCCDGCP